MPKKKSKAPKEAREEEPDDEEEGEESVADLMAKMGMGSNEDGDVIDVSDAKPAAAATCEG